MSNKNTVRKYLLITLCHADRRENVTKEMILLRIRDRFECGAIVVAKEVHQEGGYHYHIAVLTSSASKNTATKIIRRIFSEWEGRAIDVKFHKTWATVIAYTIKEDKEPTIWGEYNMEQLREICRKKQKHKRIECTPPQEILDRLAQKKDILEIYDDEILKAKVLAALPRMKEAHEDLKTIRMMRENVMGRIQDYLKEKGNPSEYHIEELQEKYLLIDWIACQLCFARPIKTKQLFLYGQPSTQKTLIFNLLQKVVSIYYVSSRRNDFTGANDHYDLWVFDEFHEPGENTGMYGANEEGTAYANTILRILDGQECRLDSKYARVFTKKRNVPIVMIANRLPHALKSDGPFKARFLRLRFHSNIRNLEEKRIIATLWGCMQRRIQESPYALLERIPDEEVKLDYNECEGIVVPRVSGETQRIKTATNIRKALQKKEDNPEERKEQIEQLNLNELYFFSRQGQCLEIRGVNIEEEELVKHNEDKGKSQAVLFIKDKETSRIFSKRQNPLISLIDLATIPLRKREQEEEEREENGVDPFKRIGKIETIETKVGVGEEKKYATQTKLYRNKDTLGALIYRSSNPEHEDYATWPLQLIAPKTKRETENERIHGQKEDWHQVKKRTWNALIQIKQKEEQGKWSLEKNEITRKKIWHILKQIEETPESEQLKIYRIEMALCGGHEPWNEDD